MFIRSFKRVPSRSRRGRLSRRRRRRRRRGGEGGGGGGVEGGGKDKVFFDNDTGYYEC